MPKRLPDHQAADEGVRRLYPWPALMDDEAVAAYFSTSTRWVWQAAAKGDIPKPIKIPGSRLTRWRREQLDERVEQWADEAGA